MAFAQAITKRCLSTTAARKAIEEVSVIGGGLMGAGIAQVYVINIHCMYIYICTPLSLIARSSTHCLSIAHCNYILSTCITTGSHFAIFMLLTCTSSTFVLCGITKMANSIGLPSEPMWDKNPCLFTL